MVLISANYAPSADLATVIARHYVFSVDLPDSVEIIDNILSETAFLRVLLRGDWAAHNVPGTTQTFGQMVMSGPNSRPQRVRVRGGFDVVGLAFRPAGWRMLFDEPTSSITDRFLPFFQLCGSESDALFSAIEACPRADHAVMIAAVEHWVRQRMAARRVIDADPAMIAFEKIARNDSTMPVARVAERLGMSQRQLERASAVYFGMSPKTVLRRSRFLDMATAIRGLSSPSEEELAALRYADQSHLNREFRRFIGMTPGQFAATPTPLFTAGLELRVLRKRDDAAAQPTSSSSSRHSIWEGHSEAAEG